ncbi:hypothetical protein [Armatimonas sp.]|uniref:hypothetical protein n=1 Tax=Armatimonas sp. TaxID=1872638 RepID=UPI00286C27ED|nr:hypothetical protein [Armatimonas sp.]
MSRFLSLAILALTPTLPVLAQAQEPTPKLTATTRTETSLREALTTLFEKQKVPYILGPGIEGKVSFTVDLEPLKLNEAIELLLAAADKPIHVEVRQNGVWILRLAPTAPPAPPQVNIAPAQVHVTNNMPKNPTIASLNLASTGDPLVAVLELQASLLEQELATGKSQYGPNNEIILALQEQLSTVKRQLTLRRAQATKKTTAAATTKRR